MPDPKAQDNFTAPHSRIMKGAGGGFDASYNGQTAVDDTAHIIMAAELGNNASDVGELLPMIEAVAANLGQVPEQVLADAGYRSEAVFEQLAGSGIDAVIALGREGKRFAEIDPETHPHTAAMAVKLQTDEGKAAYRRRKWLAGPPQRLDQERAGVQTDQPTRPASRASRVETRLPGTQLEAHGRDECRVRAD